MTNVLVAGGKGFIGSNVVEHLSNNTDYMIGVTDFNLARTQFVHSGDYDFIVNFASNSSVQQSIENPLEIIENNVMSTTRLLEYAREYPPKLFIQFSTVEANEITNPYAASKKAQEDICKAYALMYGIPVLVIRSTNVIGKNQNPEKFVPKLIQQIQSGQPVTIHRNNDGTIGVRAYNPVANVAHAIHFIMKHHKMFIQHPFQTTGIPGSKKLNNLEMAETIAFIMDIEPEYHFVESSTIRPSYLREYPIPLNHTWFGVGGYKPIQNIDECLKEIIW